METRGSPSKGKQPVARDTESVASDEDMMLELKANLQALQEAQVKQSLAAQHQSLAAQGQIKSLEAAVNQIVDILKKLDVPQGPTLVAAPPSNRATASTSSSVPLRPSVEAADPQPSLSPSPDPTYPLNQRRYKPKIGDVVWYEGPDGIIKYQAWKELIFDKFEKDHLMFETP
jgi:hypothetical protein